MQPNEKRILITLKKAKAKGIKELDLVGDIKASYARKIKSHINKKLGDKAVYTDLGVWYLHREYWETPMIEFRDIMILTQLKKYRTLAIWAFSTAMVVAILIGVLIGLTIELEYA